MLSALSGSVVDLAELVAFDPDWLNIIVHFIRAEGDAARTSRTFPYFPRLIEAAVLTLSDPEKYDRLIERRQNSPLLLESNVCDPDVFDDLVVHSGEARSMSKYACTLLKQVCIYILPDKFTKKTVSQNSDRKLMVL